MVNELQLFENLITANIIFFYSEALPTKWMAEPSRLRYEAEPRNEGGELANALSTIFLTILPTSGKWLNEV